MSQCLIAKDAHGVFLQHPTISINDRRTDQTDTPAWYAVTKSTTSMSQLDLSDFEYLLDLLLIKEDSISRTMGREPLS